MHRSLGQKVTASFFFFFLTDGHVCLKNFFESISSFRISYFTKYVLLRKREKAAVQARRKLHVHGVSVRIGLLNFTTGDIKSFLELSFAEDNFSKVA